MSAELLKLIKNDKNGSNGKFLAKRPVSVPSPPPMPKGTGIKKKSEEDFFTTLGGKAWRETRAIVDAILGNTVALALIAIATFLAADMYVETYPESILKKLLDTMKNVKVLARVSEMIGKDPERFLGSFYFLSIFWIVRGTERIVIIVASVISLTMFQDVVTNALAALLVLAVFRVRDKELRLIAVVLAAGYMYLYVTGEKPEPPSSRARTPTTG